MRAAIPFILLIYWCVTIVMVSGCSGTRMGYADTRVQDSIAEAQTRDLAPRTIKGEEAKRYGDSLIGALMKLTGLDSASFFDMPEGYARHFKDDGTWYYHKLSEEEIERNKQFAGVDSDADHGPIIAFDLEGQQVGMAGFREKGKPYQISTDGLPSGTYMLAIPGEKKMIKIVVQ